MYKSILAPSSGSVNGFSRINFEILIFFSILKVSIHIILGGIFQWHLYSVTFIHKYLGSGQL